MDTEKTYQEDMDRVEAAFKRLDTDGDGYIDWEEFEQVKFGSQSPQQRVLSGGQESGYRAS